MITKRDTEARRHGDTSPLHQFTESPGRIFFNKVTIIGVGLIGASFALALRKHNLCTRIAGFGRNVENLKKAKERGIVDSFDLDPSEACADSDLILFATPVGTFTDIAGKIINSLKLDSIVTDVGSVKGNLVKEMEELMPDGVWFVGGHPIAGSNRSGVDTATAEIFRGAKCIITPTDKTDKNALEKIIALWKSFGSVIKIIDPYEHDKIYSVVSHLPHLVAYEILNTVADIDSSYLNFSGQGFMDTTRIATSSPELWRDICLLNKENLLESIDVFKKNLDRVSQYLRAYDSESLEQDFQKARTLREGIEQN
ncbi:MAG: prephenate dehydrogenase/arogenate dehydrogenase family protein [Nitrospirae bacterium]|jgi:prephenate dehydrogenase|nr:prephenate dehydrogenase/arogenate dehydrogenase family protein [Nitrospirota bacterium]